MTPQLATEYQHRCNTATDINEHLPILKKYVEMVPFCRVVEIGTRDGNSAIGLLAGDPVTMVCVDIAHYAGVKSHFPTLVDPAVTGLTFVDGSSLEVDIPECDFLFIDSKHTYEQLSQELGRHGDKSKHYIGFHDTVTYGSHGDDGSTPGLMQAIEEFVTQHKQQWSIAARFDNNNGLLILERIYRK